MKNKKSSAIIYGSKATAAALEKFVKYVNNKDTRTISMTKFWCLQLRIYFTTFFSIFIVDFEHKNVYYVMNISAEIQNPNKLQITESELALSFLA